MRGSPFRARPGTTVVELVVALVITASVAAAGAAAFGQLIDRREQLLVAATHTERAAALRALLREWIVAGTVELPSTTQQIRALPAQRVAAATDHELVFATNALTPAGIPGVRVRLYVDEDPETLARGLTIEYRPRPSAEYVRRELDPAIRRMVVEYLDADAGRWITTADAVAIRPVAVRVTFPPTEGNEARLRQLPLTFPIGAMEPRPSPDAPVEGTP